MTDGLPTEEEMLTELLGLVEGREIDMEENDIDFLEQIEVADDITEEEKQRLAELYIQFVTM